MRPNQRDVKKKKKKVSQTFVKYLVHLSTGLVFRTLQRIQDVVFALEHIILICAHEKVMADIHYKSKKTYKLVYATGYKTAEEKEGVLLAGVDREGSSEKVKLS